MLVVENFGESVYSLRLKSVGINNNTYSELSTTITHVMYTFMLESVIHGYHKYKGLWDAAVNGVGLLCEREPENSHDTFAVAVQKQSPSGNVTIGHTPQVISTICFPFI